MSTNTTDTTAQNATPATPAEPSMAEYAANLEAELYGKAKPRASTAAAADATPPAAATDDDDHVDDQSAAATDDDATDGKTTTESATEDGEGNTEDQQSKGKKGINKRFSEMTAKQKELQALADKNAAEAAEAKRQAEEARAEAERLRLEAERAQAAIPQVPSAEEDPVPNRAEFDDPDDYAAAIAAHTARQELRRAALASKEAAEARAAEARKAADEARQAEAFKAMQELQANFQKKVVDAKTDYPDFDEKVTNNESIVLRNDVFFAIQRASDSPHILYHLADHPEVAQDLNKLNPMEAAMRIGEIQAELRLARKPKVSQAAAPIKPIGNRASPQPKSLDEMSPTEYAAEMERREKAAGRTASRVRLI